MDYRVVTNPIEFLNQILSEVPSSSMPKYLDPILRFHVHYIWRGLFESRRRYIWNNRNLTIDGKLDIDEEKSTLCLMCLAVYKSFLPIVYLILLGYTADTLILFRTCQERISILGYLEQHREKIVQYEKGKHFYSKANKWAKYEWEDDNYLKMYMTLYGLSSKFSHSNFESIGGLILTDNNYIGKAFRQDIQPDSSNDLVDYFTPFIALNYTLRLADITVARVFEVDDFIPLPNDPSLLSYFSEKDREQTYQFFNDHAESVKAKSE